MTGDRYPFQQSKYFDKTDKGEKVEIPIKYYQRHAVNLLKIINKLLPVITNFDHNEKYFIFEIQELKMGVLKTLISPPVGVSMIG